MSVKITELPFLNTLDDNDVLAGVDTSADTTSKVTVGTLKEYIDSNTTYTAGTNIDITNNVVSAPNVYTKSEVNGLLPTKVSDLTNDSGFITKAVNDLTNYYTSSNTYTKTEVNNLISQVNQFNVEIVQTLPSSNIDPHTIYFVAKTGSTGDVYDEYIYINNAWELIGSTDIDLTGYVKNTDYASSSTGGVFKTSNSFATDVSNGYLNAQGKTYTQYGSLNNNAFISKQTLENVITGKELTNADDLEELADDLSEDINYVGREVDSLSTVYNALPYASDDGTSITLNDTVETKFKKLDLQGNGSQASDPSPSSPVAINVVSGDNSVSICGKNLFDEDYYKKVTYDSNVYKYTPLKIKGNRTLYFKTILKSGKTSISGLYLTVSNKNNPNLTGNKSYFLISNGTINSTTSNYLDFTGEEDLYLDYYPTSVTPQDIFDTYNIIVSLENADYEPYTGTTYPINLPVENLLSSSMESGSYDVSTGEKTANQAIVRNTTPIPVKPNTTYILSYDGNPITTGVLYYDNSNNYLTYQAITNTYFTTPNNCYNMNFYYYIGSTTVDMEKFQLEPQTKVNSYTPYGTTPIELCKIGNYQDYFYKSNGNWYKYGAIKTLILNDTQNWNVNGNFNTTYTTSKPSDMSSATLLYSDYYVRLADTGELTSSDYGILIGSVINVKNKDISSNTEMKNWFSTNNTKLYYPSSTPTPIQITYQPLIDQLNELYIAKSKLGQTNISQVNNDLPFILDVEGAKLAGSGGGGGTTDYTDLTNKPSINSVTLSGNKSLSDLGIQPAGNYVTNTDYATSNKAGIVSVPSIYGAQTYNGYLSAISKNYSDYSSASDNLFIGKGTLENVITGKQLVDSSTLSNSFEYYDEGIREFISAQIDSLASITNAFPTDKKEGNYMVLDETAKVRFKDVILKGNMSQASSPTPSNPVDVKTVSGTYNISFIGKNKLQNNIQDETYKSLTITNNGDGSFSLNGTPTGSFGRNIATNLFLPAGTYTISANTIPSGFYVALDGRSDTTLNSSTFSKTFTLNDDTTISEVGTWITKDYTYNDTIFVQIERSDRQTDYEPYDKNTYYNFNLRDYSLCKIGNYQDEIYFDSGTWYRRSAVGAMRFDGSSDFVADWSSGNYYCYKKASSTSYIVPNTFVSKYFADLTTADFTAKNKYGIYMDNTGIYIVTDISTLSSFNTWLDTNQPTVYYASKSANSREIEDNSLLMDLYYLASLQACKGSTTIYAEGTNAPLIMEIEAVQDLSSVLDRLELLENSNNS